MKQLIVSFVFLALIGFNAAPAFAIDPPTDEQLRAQSEERTNAKTKALWDRLTPEDRDAVTELLRKTDNLLFLKPDVIGYLSQGRRTAAIKLVADYYHLDTNRAAVVVDLIGYANDLE